MDNIETMAEAVVSDGLEDIKKIFIKYFQKIRNEDQQTKNKITEKIKVMQSSFEDFKKYNNALKNEITMELHKIQFWGPDTSKNLISNFSTKIHMVNQCEIQLIEQIENIKMAIFEYINDKSKKDDNININLLYYFVNPNDKKAKTRKVRRFSFNLIPSIKNNPKNSKMKKGFQRVLKLAPKPNGLEENIKTLQGDSLTNLDNIYLHIYQTVENKKTIIDENFKYYKLFTKFFNNRIYFNGRGYQITNLGSLGQTYLGYYFLIYPWHKNDIQDFLDKTLQVDNTPGALIDDIVQKITTNKGVVYNIIGAKSKGARPPLIIQACTEYIKLKNLLIGTEKITEKDIEWFFYGETKQNNVFTIEDLKQDNPQVQKLLSKYIKDDFDIALEQIKDFMRKEIAAEYGVVNLEIK